MHLLLALGATILAAVALNIKSAAIASSNGNWGGAVGDMLFGPIVVFFLIHTVLYYGTRLVRRKSLLKSYSRSRLCYISAAITVLGVIGSLGQPM